MVNSTVKTIEEIEEIRPHVSIWQKIWQEIRNSLFSSPVNIIISLIVLFILLLAIPALWMWLIQDANFAAETAQECKNISGACWAFIGKKYRFILFGIYPYEEQWRPLLACVVMIGIVIMAANRRFWNKKLLIWIAIAIALVCVLMWGFENPAFGLPYVETSYWGGLPVTLILSFFGITLAFPLGVLLALGRRSKMPIIRVSSVIYIELIRGIPLISLLFMSSVMLPLFFPDGFNVDKLLRAQIAVILFAAAYIAETVRGGLQAMPKGQYEGAESLGLNYWQTMRKIILPQALTAVIPPLVGIFIGLFKDTSLVVIIGIFDLTNAAKSASTSDTAWQGFHIETYVFIAFIYFIFCYAISKYARTLERYLARANNR